MQIDYSNFKCRKKIPGLQGEIDTQGNVYSFDNFRKMPNGSPRKMKGRNLKPWLSNRGYWVVGIKTDQGKLKKALVHRLVALTFIPNPFGKKEVNHIDRIRTNTNLANLEWNTPSENQFHGWTNPERIHHAARKVNQIKNGVIIKTWNSAAQAAKEGGFWKNPIGECCKKKPRFKTHKGFHWGYAE